MMHSFQHKLQQYHAGRFCSHPAMSYAEGLEDWLCSPDFCCRLLLEAELKTSNRFSDMIFSITDRTAAPLVLCNAPPASPTVTGRTSGRESSPASSARTSEAERTLSSATKIIPPSGAAPTARGVATAAACEASGALASACNGVSDSSPGALKLLANGRASCALSWLTAAACIVT